jgi:ferredoxin-thioredoxin reductase catalytic subunit
MQLAMKFFISIAIMCYAFGFITFYWYYFKKEQLDNIYKSFKSHLKAFQEWLIIHWKYFKKRFKETVITLIAYAHGEDVGKPIEETVPVPVPEPTMEEAIPWYEVEAKRLGVMINPNTELRDTVLEGLERNKVKYGERYCPCMNPSYYTKGNPSSLVCPCYKMEHNQICNCGLFVSNTALSHPGMKYETKDDGSVGLVPLDGTEGPSSSPDGGAKEEVKAE